MLHKVLFLLFIFIVSLSAKSNVPHFFDNQANPVSSRNQCVLAMDNNNKFIRVSYKSIDILNEKNLEIEKSLAIRW